ncbi:MAG TPA: alkaline phosphatase family protein [Steroidobacteraceae bacterium]|jgi:phospholipase C|nr:alkaline phosphatase family protein [Steroidobacteraceae bacterium]
MKIRDFVAHSLHGLRMAAISVALLQLSVGPVLAAVSETGDLPSPGALGPTATPIKHVIVIIGENRSFDHVFATYVPQAIHGRPQQVQNLLSEGIIAMRGTATVPGRNFYKAQQNQATDAAPDTFLLSPSKQQAFGVLPNPLAGGPSGPEANLTGFCGTPLSLFPSCLAAAELVESGLSNSPTDPENYYASLASGGTGLTSGTPDTRIQWNGLSVTDNNLLPGPFQLTGPTLQYADYAASPVHRFYQMWQQLDCSAYHASWENPSGCDGKLFSWVEVTVGAGTNGTAQPANFSTNFTTGETPAPATTGEGSTALGFYNVQAGDAPYFKSLADHYAMSDNFHQSVDGGTGANHIMLGHGDMIWFADGSGKPAQPTVSAAGLNEVENPNPAVATNNWYIEDGYGSGTGASAHGGGSYSDCADRTQPGVGPVREYLKFLGIEARCEKGHYYLLNNYNPGYEPNGQNDGFSNAYTDTNPLNTPFTVPPSGVRSIGDSLLAANISWKYYGDQWNIYQTDPYKINNPAKGQLPDEYCTICNPFQYDSSIMTNPTLVAEHIQDSTSLYADITGGNLPAVSFVKPSGLVDGHPASSKLDLFEGFSKKIVDLVQGSKYAADTAVFITFDEGGGYYDSGYVQPVDYFGDGTRIPLIVVAPFLKAPGYISHSYADHVSILKFIERNWGLQPVTRRSRDNFPNPISVPENPYVPLNTPALDDLFDFFDFPGGHGYF